MARRTPPSRLIGSGLIPTDYENQYNTAQDTYNTDLAGLGQQQSGLFQDYGFAGGIDEQGGVNFATDPNNRFGKYQQLIQSIGAQIANAKAETSGRGIGKRGLAKARESLIRDMSSGDKSSLVNSFSRSAADIFGKRGAALGARNRSFASAEGGALDWWNQYGPEDYNAVTDANPADPGASGTDPGAPAASLAGGQGGITPEIAALLAEKNGGFMPNYSAAPVGGQAKLPSASLATPNTAAAGFTPGWRPTPKKKAQPKPYSGLGNQPFEGGMY